jgi:hypothetical protein
MEPEVRFAAISRLPNFPIAVPLAMFADYHASSGTGLIVAERIAYGEAGIEPHRRKCLDHLTLDDPLPHCRAMITALARLAGAHKAGRIDSGFPFDPVGASADPIRYDEPALRAELNHCHDFAARCPHLLPPDLRSDAFHAAMVRDALRIRAHEEEIQRYLRGNPDLIALCHWNAHIDNIWFWHDDAGQPHCGLIDWGRVGQLTLGSVLWGCLSAAHHDIWDRHLGELLALFVSTYYANGGPLVTADELEFHLMLHIAVMGVARVLAFPEVILFRQPDAVDATGPHDPMFMPVAMDAARNSLHVYTVFLKLWKRHDFGSCLDRLLAR